MSASAPFVSALGLFPERERNTRKKSQFSHWVEKKERSPDTQMEEAQSRWLRGDWQLHGPLCVGTRRQGSGQAQVNNR